MWISHVDIGLYSLCVIYEKARVKMYIQRRSKQNLQPVQAECRNVYMKASGECGSLCFFLRAARAHVHSYGFKTRIGYLSDVGGISGFCRGVVEAIDLLDVTRRRLVVCY